MKHQTPEQICQKHCLVGPYGAADPVALEAVKEYARQEAEQARQEERERHKEIVNSLIAIRECLIEAGKMKLTTGHMKEALKEAGYEINEKEKSE